VLTNRARRRHQDDDGHFGDYDQPFPTFVLPDKLIG